MNTVQKNNFPPHLPWLERLLDRAQGLTGKRRFWFGVWVKSGKAAPVMEGKEQLSLAEALRCRVRYFTDGLVLGSEAFLEGFLEEKREQLSPRRVTAARKMRGGDFGELRSYRNLTDPVNA